MISRDGRLAKLRQKIQGMTTLMLMSMMVLLIQLWLVTIAIEEYLAAHHTLAIPTFLASGFCFLLNLGILKYLYILDQTS